ncbi:MAG: hypothetical protein AAF889_09090, partial [Cyanobacteria bacterium P01_D01_bin.73]
MTVSISPKSDFSPSDLPDLLAIQPSSKAVYAAPSKNPKPTQEQYRPKVTQPLKVLAIGDSIVYGYGDVSGGGWVERLRRQWMHPNS